MPVNTKILWQLQDHYWLWMADQADTVQLNIILVHELQN